MLKALMLRKKINDKQKELEGLRAADADFEKREEELKGSIEEVETDEERSAVDAAIDDYEKKKKEHDEKKQALEKEIGDLEAELRELEEAQDTTPTEAPAPVERKKEVKPMNRNKFFGMNLQERTAFIQRDDVQAFLGEVRSCIKEKRALTNVGLTIPTVMLGLLRENIEDYSKLYKHVNVRSIGGDGRLVIMGSYAEAVWTDCCANLNELNLGFYDEEFDCWKVGGFYAICNANLEDSDLDLAAELLTAIGQAIGLALDKAILYGTGNRMPLGVVARLAQTTEPSGYPATARPWADLHTTNIKSIAETEEGAALFKAFIIDAGAAKGRYSRGEKVWAMNETTYTTLIADAMTIDAGGAIVSGVNGVMPVVGGVIEVLSFIPDNVIVGGYFDLYTLAERAGQKFATSEHVRFLQDQTVFKGTARYDGAPSIAEAFVAIGINGVTPTAAMTFAADTANTGA